MESEKVRELLRTIIEEHLGLKIDDMDKNLFDDFAAYELLYIVEPIEDIFRIPIAQLLEGSDYSVMTVNNLAEKIGAILNDKAGFY